MTQKAAEHRLGLTALSEPGEVGSAGRKSYFLGIGIFFLISLLYAGSALGTVYFESYLVRFLFALLMGFNIAQLFVIGHDACHNSLTPGRAVNHIIARLALLPSLHACSLWEYGHNANHHVYAMLKHKDPFGVPMSKEEYDALPSRKQWAERFFRSPAGILFCHLIRGWWPKMFVPPPYNEMFHRYASRKIRNAAVYWADCLLVWAFFLVWAVILPLTLPDIYEGVTGWEVFVFTFCIPFLFWNVLMAFVTYLHHTHPEIPWFENEEEWSFTKAQVHCSTHVIFPGPMNTIVLFIMEHSAHHLMREKIPLYRLKRVQDRIEARLPGDVVVLKWTWGKYCEIAKTCQLYDFKNHRWLDFAGNPTTPCLLPAQ